LGVASRIHPLLIGRHVPVRTRPAAAAGAPRPGRWGRTATGRAPGGWQRYQRAQAIARAAARALLPSVSSDKRLARRRIALSTHDPNYNPSTDTYRQIFRGHDNASAVTSHEGVTVYFDPDTSDVLGFSIANFSAYYAAHVTPDGEFEVNLPVKVPANLEEEMDYDLEAITSGVRIAEFY
jgi:hypothetical protein